MNAMPESPCHMTHTAVIGCLLGTAVGDALGLPYEGLSPRRAAGLLGPPDRYRFFLRQGMVSDDTEHTCLVAQSLIASGGNLERFRTDLARRLRLWLLGLPAGIGGATLRAILRLWFGITPKRSGVFSAGNGPAMRAAILGVAIADQARLRDFVRASTLITHSDPKAESGALAVALAARLAITGIVITPDDYIRQLRMLLADDNDALIALLTLAAQSAAQGDATATFADSLGLSNGVSGYVYHSVPVALQAWFRHPYDFRGAVTAVIRCGGDTDTTAAIVGGIVGATVGQQGIPSEWLTHLREWPRSVAWIRRLGYQLTATRNDGAGRRPLDLPFSGLLARNSLFLLLVLLHGFRRLLPPY